jgi:hypothetical protein
MIRFHPHIIARSPPRPRCEGNTPENHRVNRSAVFLASRYVLRYALYNNTVEDPFLWNFAP